MRGDGWSDTASCSEKVGVFADAGGDTEGVVVAEADCDVTAAASASKRMLLSLVRCELLTLSVMREFPVVEIDDVTGICPPGCSNWVAGGTALLSV